MDLTTTIIHNLDLCKTLEGVTSFTVHYEKGVTPIVSIEIGKTASCLGILSSIDGANNVIYVRSLRMA